MVSSGLDHLLDRCAAAERVIIFGAGQIGRQFVGQLLDRGIRPYAIFSNYPEKDGESVDGIPIIKPCPPEGGKKALYVIALANEDICDSLKEQLASLGVPADSMITYEEARYDYFASLSQEGRKAVLTELYRERIGQELDWDHPRRYTEVLNWEKLNLPESELRVRTRLADKLLVRDYVQEKVGQSYLSRVLHVWDDAEEIDFDALPEAFVLKCNHGSGMNIVVPDRSKLDKAEAIKHLNRWKSRNYAYISGMYEMQYSDIPRKIFCEEYLEGLNSTCPQYDVFCFHGQPQWIWRLRSPHSPEERGRFYDAHWKAENFVWGYPLDPEIVPRPAALDEVLDLSRKLSQGFRHVRVDLYEMPDGSIHFSELTFSPWAGLEPFVPGQYDEDFGKLILTSGPTV